MNELMKEQMNIVIVGHVDHGKSTVIGRLLADTNSLPQGKLEQVKAQCLKNAKPFEYAFLLDALKDEQSQGITIDTARSFFKTQKRNYIIIDAPGHIEFLKNMVTGAARAEAAFLVIDAKEGIRENSRRHGYLVSMLGIRQVVILVNKMDLVNFDQKVFENIKKEYTEFLSQINVVPQNFIPIAARDGVNIAITSEETPWYNGLSVLSELDSFEKQKDINELPLRFPIQDIYKFTEYDDERRIYAGTVLSGKIAVGDKVIFYPSEKEVIVKSIERFNAPKRDEAHAEEAIGITVEPQVYVRPGELVAKVEESKPKVASKFKANIFWMGKAPLIIGKKYKLKIGTSQIALKLTDVLRVIDASELDSSKTQDHVNRHEVAECLFETLKPIAFDFITDIEQTGHFVIVDNYEISGGGIITEEIIESDSMLQQHIREREGLWEKSGISAVEREKLYKHKAKFVVITGAQGIGKVAVAKELECDLFQNGFKVYYLGMKNVVLGLDEDVKFNTPDKDEHIRRLGELARIMTDSGLIFITTISDPDDYDLESLKALNAPYEILTVNVGESNFSKFIPDLNIKERVSSKDIVTQIKELLFQKEIFLDYCI